MGEERKVYKLFLEKSEVKKPLGRPLPIWELENKMGLLENGWDCVEWIIPAHGRAPRLALANRVMNLRAVAPHSLLLSLIASDVGQM
jgi:hypothetical protein